MEIVRNKRGFAISAPLIGVVMFLIVGAAGYLMISENEQQIASVPQETALIFIAQGIEADFYNNMLQNTLEVETVNFLEGTTHKIDPDASFMTNLGDGLRRALEEPLDYLVAQNVGGTYAQAYSRLPGIACEAGVSRGGALSYIDLRVQEDGTLLVDAVTTGQSIRCSSQEPEGFVEVDLRARGYQLGVRVGEYHDLAVAAIKSANAELDAKKGEYVGEAWKLPGDESAKLAVKGNWDGVLRTLYSLSIAGADGLYVQPGSVRVFSRDGDPYEVDDLRYACSGETGYDQERNCRPNDIQITLGEECGEDQLEVEVKTEARNINIEVPTPLGVAVPITIPLDKMSEELRKSIGELLNSGVNNACLGYSSVTKICRGFIGKPNSASMKAAIFEENEGFIPPGADAPVIFNFESYGFDIDDSGIEDDLDCDSEEGREIVFENIKALLGKGQFEFHIKYEEGEARIEGLEEMAKKINEDRMYSDLGDEIVLQAKASFKDEEGEEVAVAEGQAAGKGKEDRGNDGIDTLNSGKPSGGWIDRITGGFEQGKETPYKKYQPFYDLLDTASGAAYRGGNQDASLALAKDAASVCKLMGFKNLLEMGDIDAAINAICGISSLADIEDIEQICNLGALFRVKNPAALAKVLKNLFGAVIAAELLEGLSLPEALAMANLDHIANLVKALEDLDVRGALKAAADVLARLGEIDAANMLVGAMNLEAAIEGGNIDAAIGAITDLGRILGLKELARLGAVAGNIAGIMDMSMNLDKLMAECKDEPPWDIACIPAGSTVCPPAVEDCSFTYGMPTFDFGLLCNKMIIDGGFQADCECIYFCPEGVKVPLFLKPTFVANHYYMDMSVRVQIGDMISSFDLPVPDLGGLGSIDYCIFDP